jgi:hypothetical protein
MTEPLEPEQIEEIRLYVEAGELPMDVPDTILRLIASIPGQKEEAPDQQRS